MSDLMMGTFGGMLRHLRIQKNMTLREAARKLKMGPGNYSRMENFRASPPDSRAKVQHIARALGFGSAAEEALVSMAFSHHVAVLQDRFYSGDVRSPKYI